MARALCLAGLACLGLAGSTASAAIFINVGNQGILPDTPGQSIAITISNDGPPVPLGGIELLIQVADGGPEAGGSILAPRIDSVNLLAGTPFEGKDIGGQFGAIDNTSQRQFWNVISTTATLETGSDQLLATITFDSTGFSSGLWDLSLGGFAGANTRLLSREGAEIEVQIGNGTLAVVPEPAAAGAVAGALLLGALVARRARQGSGAGC